ncbi:MAG TPA: hypothetical protein VF595_13960 [Tepidisphaeraceae bacterium]|jgi:hypothetical protein
MASAIFTPSRRELACIALAAIALRVVVLIVMGLKAHDLAGMPYRSDGIAYIDNARRINGDAMPSAYDQRVFVGLPWLIAMTHRLGVPYGAGAQAFGLVLPGLVCAGTALWLRDRRIGWAMAVLPPHWVLDTACVMNESLMIGLCVLAMITLRQQRFWGVLGAAVLFAAAGMVRPMACFAVMGALALLLQARRPGRALALSLATLALLAGMFFAFKHVYWNPLDNMRAYDTEKLAYDGQVFTYPFGSFVEVGRARGVLRPTYVYKAAYMVAALIVLGLAAVAWWRSRRPLDAWAVAWWGGNVAFVTCIGSHWGVDIAQRSLMWAAPAAYWTLRDWLPVRWWVRLAWALLAIPWVFITSQS